MIRNREGPWDDIRCPGSLSLSLSPVDTAKLQPGLYFVSVWAVGDSVDFKVHREVRSIFGMYSWGRQSRQIDLL